MPATISDVAKVAKVSKQTVSRVINNEKGVAEATWQRVSDAIITLGYSPNPWAQRLARGSSGLISLIFDDAAPSYVMIVMNGLMEASVSTSYEISVRRCKADHPEDVDAVIRMAAHHQVDGLIITPPCDSFPRLLNALQDLDFPFVLLTPQDRDREYAWVAASDKEGSCAATQHLIELGHQRIAYIQGNSLHQASWARLDGYRQAMWLAGLPVLSEYICQGDWTFESGRSCTPKLLALDPRPTAIVAGGDEIAAGIIQQALGQGLSLPEELSVVGFDDAFLARQLWPPLTTIRQRINEISKISLDILVNDLVPSSRQPTSAVVPTQPICFLPRSSFNPH